jgi:ankyrin repeat protein
MAKFLLENGADVNAISNIGDTPLKRALVCNCGADVVGLLVAHGADVRVLDSVGTYWTKPYGTLFG